MKVGIIQGSSQKDKNSILYETAVHSLNTQDYEIINFGIFDDEEATYSYIETSILISLLINSQSVDFIITGCSSGQGMMLACNALPGIICGYTPTAIDAFLFGRINNGNVVSLPLGLHFGWASEIELANIMGSLFSESLGLGYPKQDADRKIVDTLLLKSINSMSKHSIEYVVDHLSEDVLDHILRRDRVIDYILKNGKNTQLVDKVRELVSDLK